MLRFFFTLLVGWSVSSWVLAETFFFFPSVKPVVASIERLIEIPRHDEWDLKRFDKEASWLRDSLKSHSETSRFATYIEFDRAPKVQVANPHESPMLYHVRNAGFDSFSDDAPLQWWGETELSFNS